MEGKGSFQINNKLQIVFELAQTHDKMIIYGLHKLFNVSSNVKVRKGDGYTTLSTKQPRVLEEIMVMLEGKLLGIKSFEYKLWCYAYNTKNGKKRSKAKELLRGLRGNIAQGETNKQK